MLQYISHVRKDKENNFETQTNEDHSLSVALLAKHFADKFNFGDWAYLMGILHDKGKEQTDFQTHIKRSSGMENGKDIHVKHAYVGALIAKEYFQKTFPFLPWAILCHHSGLYDYTYFEKIMNELKIPEEISTDIHLPSKLNLDFPDLARSVAKEGDKSFFCWNHIQRVLFSCLVDADDLDTEKFMNLKMARLRETKKNTLKELLPLLENNLNAFKADTNVNKIRKEILDNCSRKSDSQVGFYSMTVPTGGGKTLSSLLWAMKHAIHNNQDRIIICIPYTSIITQTAEIFCNIFGKKNVLEHHSNVNMENMSSIEKLQAKLAAENWDYPIIVTTNVQFFESIYANRTSKCRKLHNICNSVVILDEVQTLPTDYLQPIIDAMKAYNKCFNTSFLFTTASMPVLSKESIKIEGLCGIDSIHELIPKKMDLQNRLKRVDIEFDNEESSYDDIAARLRNENKVLCIVNTRRDAYEIFRRIIIHKQKFHDEINIHLSKNMCPEHIAEKLKQIKSALDNGKYKIIRVISTQLIEAGVDIDFPVVYRQKAGLDSIIQAAGRCNREGKLNRGLTHVFKIQSEKDFGMIRQARQATESIQSKDIQSTEAMSEYFNQFYYNISQFDSKGICNMLNNPLKMMFQTAADNFHLIDNEGYNVIVNFKNCEIYVNELKRKGISYDLSKNISKFAVNISKRNFDAFLKDGILEEINGYYYLKDKERYNGKIGLITDEMNENINNF